MLRRLIFPAVALALLVPGCAADNDAVLADAAHDDGAATATKALLLDRARALHSAAVSLQTIAPAHPWSAATAPEALTEMRDAWKNARLAYQGLEGAVDMLFPDFDAALDARYDSALVEGPDPNPFDDEGFTGLHAIERVLWADSIAPEVLAWESSLPGYVAPSFPDDEEHAGDFKNELCARFVADTDALMDGIEALDLRSPEAYEAAIRLVEAQLGKMKEAGAGAQESRYAGFSLADMRENLATASATHAIFHAWLVSKPRGAHVDGEIAAGFAKLDQVYAAQSGDALPSAPAGWSSVDPTDDMRATPFGVLFLAVREEADDTRDGSLAHSMDEAAEVLGIVPGATPTTSPTKPVHDDDDI